MQFDKGQMQPVLNNNDNNAINVEQMQPVLNIIDNNNVINVGQVTTCPYRKL